ncbi:unnamed protein product [Lampetra planeri]
MLCDSCAMGSEDGALSNVKIVRPPSNGTSPVQPVNAGIAESFRRRYRALALAREHRRASVIQDGSGEPTATTPAKCPNLLDSLHLQKEAWICATPATIASCYREAGAYAP